MNLTYFISPKMTEKGDNRKEYQKAYWTKYKGIKRRSQPRINLSDSEYKLFNQLAKKEGVSLSKLIKNSKRQANHALYIFYNMTHTAHF